MTRTTRSVFPAGLLGFACIFTLACGGATKPSTAIGSNDPNRWPTDDRSLCERFVHWRKNAQLETSETAGPGSLRPNIRRVFKAMGDHDNEHMLLLCREIDTNLDGIKDVVRTFNDKGEPLHEEADTNFDGKIDVWVNFADGRIEEEDVDLTFASGRPNEWKFYVGGQLSRVKRNTHCPNGNPDTWEIYYRTRLERVGTDSTCDGHVDRWDRDGQLLAMEEGQTSAADDGGLAAATPVLPSSDLPDAGANRANGGSNRPDAGKR